MKKDDDRIQVSIKNETEYVIYFSLLLRHADGHDIYTLFLHPKRENYDLKKYGSLISNSVRLIANSKPNPALVRAHRKSTLDIIGLVLAKHEQEVDEHGNLTIILTTPIIH